MGPGLKRPPVSTMRYPGREVVHDTRTVAIPKRSAHNRRSSARFEPLTEPVRRRACLTAAVVVAALCAGCGKEDSGASHVSELAGQWTGKERGGRAVLCLRLRRDGTFEWQQQQVGGQKDAWSREGRWKPVSLLGEDEGGFTYYLELSVSAGERDAATPGPQPEVYEVRLSPHPTTQQWVLRTPWGEFTVERDET